MPDIQRKLAQFFNAIFLTYIIGEWWFICLFYLFIYWFIYSFKFIIFIIYTNRYDLFTMEKYVTYINEIF